MSRLRFTAGDVAKMLDESDLPVYVVDDRRRIVLCNAACGAGPASMPFDLVGQTCVYHAPTAASGAAAVAAALCPPPKAFSGQTQSGYVSRLGDDGKAAFRRGWFVPLDAGVDESAPVLAVLEATDCADPVASGDAAATDDYLHEQVRLFRQQMAGRYRADSLIGASPAIVRGASANQPGVVHRG